MKIKHIVTTKERQELIENTTCTLNKKPAIIRGRLLPFAVIAEKNGPLAIEYAWLTAKKIVNAGGKFEV